MNRVERPNAKHEELANPPSTQTPNASASWVLGYLGASTFHSCLSLGFQRPFLSRWP